MKGDRAHKYRLAQYEEGRYAITRCADGNWIVDEMAEFEDGGYDIQALSATDREFPTLREARAWCKQQMAQT